MARARGERRMGALTIMRTILKHVGIHSWNHTVCVSLNVDPARYMHMHMHMHIRL